MPAPADGTSGRWQVQTLRGRAEDLLARDWPGAAAPCCWFVEPEGPALVLGSTQPWSVADHDSSSVTGVSVVRRRSGGGAVLVEPGGLLWVDVLVPAGDPLEERDVARAFHWLGRAWAEALERCGLREARSWEDGPVQTAPRWSPLVCFASLGSGEVAVGGRKVVGISQRRTRSGAMFQCAVLLEWAPGRLLYVLRLDDGERRSGALDLAEVAVGTGIPAADLRRAFVSSLAGY
ncbi:MAG: lipoyl protein ligase domain-containing protein [Acidimicrobiales bacterium]